MKKKAISIMSLVLTGTMIAVSFTGCGTRTKATNQEVAMDEETIIVADEEASEDIVVTEDEITEEEAVEDEEEEAEVAGNKYDYIFIYSDAQETKYEPDLDACMPFGDEVVEYTFTSDIPVYYTDGWIAGYVKAGSTITFDNGSSEWLRFVPNVEGLTIPYLMVRNDEIIEHTNNTLVDVEDAYKMLPEDAEEFIIANINMREDNADITFISAPESDMETIEFIIWKQYRKEGLRNAISDALLNEEITRNYLTYYVECTGDEERIDCVIYYKDMIGIE